MATSPELVRSGLVAVTSAAIADARAVMRAGRAAEEIRAALFAAIPLVVGNYSDGSSALALDWYEEQRDEADTDRPFTPTPIRLVTDDDVRAMVAETTVSLRDAAADGVTAAATTSLRLLSGGIQKQVASGFWDTITGNVAKDPSADGWLRYARPGACKFCLMIAGRGAVFRESTARFSAHRSCHCLAGPSFDPDAPTATAIQYVASEPTRTPEQRAKLREYLNAHYPDAPG